jgi:deoxyribonuclease-4
VRILLETTAGQGTALCGRLEHLAFLLENTAMPERLGVCLDTCHMFAAGYDLKSPKGYRATLKEIDKSIGFARVAAIHINDCKGPRGSRLDRHEHIGKGTLGLAAFRRIVNEPLFKHLPMILETPKTNDAGKEMDPVNLAVLRRLLKKKK